MIYLIRSARFKKTGKWDRGFEILGVKEDRL